MNNVVLKHAEMKGQRERRRGREKWKMRQSEENDFRNNVLKSSLGLRYLAWGQLHQTFAVCLSVCLHERERKGVRERKRERERWRTSISWSRSVCQSHAWSPSALWALGCWCWHLLLGHPHTCTYTRTSAHFLKIFYSLKGIIAIYISM